MRRQSKGYEIDMCNGTLANKILLFALPLMASSLLQLLFNAADVVVVGQFCGKASLAAVGLVRVPPGPGSREPVYLLSHHLGNHRSGPHHHVPGDSEKGVRQGTGERSLLSVCGWTPSGSDGAVKRKSGWGLCAEISAASACLKRKNRPTENFSGVMTV